MRDEILTLDGTKGSAFLSQYGTPRHSGRYPWGSGGNTVTDSIPRHMSFFDALNRLRASGLSNNQIADAWGITSTEFRSYNTIFRAERKRAQIVEAEKLKAKMYSNEAIREKMGLKNESVVRGLLAPGAADRLSVLETVVNRLRGLVNEAPRDVGDGVQNHLGISKERLKAAITVLKLEGYDSFPVQVDQQGTAKGLKSTIQVLAKPGVKYRDIVQDLSQIKLINEMSDNGGRTFHTTLPPLSMSSKRIQVRYDEDGGTGEDGTLYVRPGVPDISLGGRRYAQVRVLVDKTHYMKGMALYKDDLPDGVDIQFNTSKPAGTPVKGPKQNTVLKNITDDPDMPFGAEIRNQVGIGMDPFGRPTKLTSVMNIVNEERGWDGWKKTLASQVLSKQSTALAKQQLDKYYEKKKTAFEEIQALTNPAVRKKLLEAFAESADSSAVNLEAHHLPRQATKVILPMNSLKPNEIYAPTYRNGERVALIRYPHGGTFEIPELVVNNNHAPAVRMLGKDITAAVAINSEAAKRLSGADFDGDTVLVIPNNSGKIKSTPALEGLRNFDPHTQYREYPGMRPIAERTMQKEMGVVSNLITDMTIRNAPFEEVARAVRHSMVIIDSYKHNLDYRQSALDNNIAELKNKYQRLDDDGKAGASTLLSRARSDKRVVKRVANPQGSEVVNPYTGKKVKGPIDPSTGQKVFKDVGEPYINKQGKPDIQRIKVKRLADTDDANTLSSGTKIEKIYADHSNKLKALANQARLEAYKTKPIQVNPSAKKAYAKQVTSLKGKLDKAERNRPLERQAHVLASTKVALRKQADPSMSEKTLKKVKSQALAEARLRVGADKIVTHITDDEWDAIQAGAISNNMLTQLLRKADLTRVQELATPRTPFSLDTSKMARAQALAASGNYTQQEIADALGVSLSTLKRGLSG